MKIFAFFVIVAAMCLLPQYADAGGAGSVPQPIAKVAKDVDTTGARIAAALAARIDSVLAAAIFIDTTDIKSYQTATLASGLFIDTIEIKLISDDTTSWNTAVTTLGYVTADTTTWHTAYGWGDHKAAHAIPDSAINYPKEYRRLPTVYGLGVPLRDSISLYLPGSARADSVCPWDAVVELIGASDSNSTHPIKFGGWTAERPCTIDSLWFHTLNTDSDSGVIAIDILGPKVGAFVADSVYQTLTTNYDHNSLTAIAVDITDFTLGVRQEIAVRFTCYLHYEDDYVVVHNVVVGVQK